MIHQLNIIKIIKKDYKKLVKDIKVFLKESKNKSDYMAENDKKTY